MHSYIQHDLYRYGGLKGCKGFLKGLTIPGFRYIFLLRQAEKYKSTSLISILYKLMLRKYSFKYGIQIPVGTTLGAGFYIGHFGTIVINIRSQLGKNCNIAHNVTIGQANRGNTAGAPIIGNNVWIGTGAVIVGKISIGNNVLIAPLSYINFDVPDNSLVIGNPAKIISKINATEGYINWILEKDKNE